MKILLVSTAFNGLTQKFFNELRDNNHDVSVELHHDDDQHLIDGVERFDPDIIVCPFLTKKIPAEIYNKRLCIIVHPGIRGDRSASSLDHMIMRNDAEWGVTLLQADDEMDAGDIWTSHNFQTRWTTKSSIYNREISDAALKSLKTLLMCVSSTHFKPVPLDYSDPSIKGSFQPFLKQADRKIDWKKDTAELICRKIRADDGTPGVLDIVNGKEYFLFNAYVAKDFSGKPGVLIAQANKAVCIGTVDGGVWIGHLKPKTADNTGIKLPAMLHLKAQLPKVDIDYQKEGRQLPVQEVWHVIENNIAYLHFEFHNGAMSTEQCNLMLDVYRYLKSLNVKAIVLMGGEDCFSNGIHLNTIEHAGAFSLTENEKHKKQADESWANILAINKIVNEIVNTTDKMVFSVFSGSAGAGGFYLGRAADICYARKNIAINPHYRNMGGLYGSEAHTYMLKKYVKNQDEARKLVTKCLPISPVKAHALGLINYVLDMDHSDFYNEIRSQINKTVHDEVVFSGFISQKNFDRKKEDREKPLSSYFEEELKEMRINFYGKDRSYHYARERFVFKVTKVTCGKTPSNIAFHRKNEEVMAAG